MDIKRLAQILLPIAGISGIAYAFGYVIETTHFRMLGLRISVLDPVVLLGITGQFVINSMRILLDSLASLLFLFMVVILAVLWYYKRHIVPGAVRRRVEKSRLARTFGSTVRLGIRNLLLVGTLIALLVWIIVYITPVMKFNSLLMQPSSAVHTEETWSYLGMDLGSAILENLKGGKTENLEGYYRYQIYMILLGLLIMGLVQTKQKAPEEASNRQNPGQLELRESIGEWPHYARKILAGAILLHILLLPVAYGVIGKEPVFPNVIVIIDPMNLEHDDIFGLHESFKYGQDNYLLYQDSKNTYLYSIESREVTVLNTPSIYAIIHISQQYSQSLLALVQ